MTEEKLIYLSRQYSNMYGIPVRLYKKDALVYSFYPAELTADPIDLCLDEIMSVKDEVKYHIYNNILYFGIVNHGEYKFICGPVSELVIPENDIVSISFRLGIQPSEINSFHTQLKALSGFNIDTVLQMLIIYNFTVNGTMLDVSELRVDENAPKINSDVIAGGEREENDYAKTFLIESDIAQKIARGDVEGLIDGNSKTSAAGTGNLAPHLIRHHKNFFIKIESLSARAALMSGLDPGEIYRAEEKYIIKCEQLDNVDRIKNLTYHMILDYAQRVREQNEISMNDPILINSVTAYIKSNMTSSVTTAAVAEHLGMSRGGLTTKFKKETGMNLSEYIIKCKLKEAKRLLEMTSRSTLDIAYYLGFSSQSYFIRVFKKFEGTTPEQYRKDLKSL